MRKKKKFHGKGINLRPRLSVFRSHFQTSAQLINDQKGETLVSANSFEVKKGKTKTEKAKLTGELLAKKALKKKIKKVIFDRGAYRYHGRVKALAEGARKGGLKF